MSILKPRFRTHIMVCLALAVFVGCRKGEKKTNLPPETNISISEINLTGKDRLKSTVNLSWFGTDKDGYVVGYEISLDNASWIFTKSIDSTFSFDIPKGQDTTDIEFYVRAIDDDGLRDASPASLVVPIQNTPPSASFNNPLGPKDTAFVVSTFNWKSSDPDGDNSIEKIEVRFNNGQWVPINQGESIISFLVDTAMQTGMAMADLYYGNSNSPAGTIDGLLPNDFNYLYIRATDVSGELSPVDTAQVFYLKNKTPGANLLWISGQAPSITQTYRGIIGSLNVKYDLLNYGRGQIQDDGQFMPKYWDPTVKLILSLYSKIFINSGQETFPLTMLEFLAPIVQDFTNRGGKTFISTSFNKLQNLSLIRGPYPVDSLVAPKTGNSPRLHPDSTIKPLVGMTYAPLKPTGFLLDLVPIKSTNDAEDFYLANLTPPINTTWAKSRIVAAIRRPNNVWSQVFFAVELHKFTSDPTKLNMLFEEILINEF